MRTKLTLLIGIIYFNFFTGQIPDEPMTFGEYPTFYTQTVNKLNTIVPTKSNYYGQPLSLFLGALAQKNIMIKKYEHGPFDTKSLKLSFFWNMDVRIAAMNNNYAEPYIKIYFQEPYSYPEATVIFNNNYHSYWNISAENFYKNFIIEKIEFWCVNGLTDISDNTK